jgi:hypothetical protein
VTPSLKPLAPYRQYLTIVSGLENRAAIAPPVHALTPGTWLSCVAPRESQEPFGGITIDQMAAEQIGQDTPFPSLEVAAEARGGSGACERNYGCAYGSTISFRTPTMPLPMESDPRKLFERLFGQGDSPQERKAITSQYASLLDLVTRQVGDLRRRLDADDRARLDDYLDSVREIERRIAKLDDHDLSTLALPDVPVGPSFDQRLNLMFDMLALAYQANLTRVFTFMMAAEATNLTYTQIGIADAFHPLSHHQNDASKMERLVKIQTYHMQAFAQFVARLAAMPDGDGSVLDHSLLMYGGNMSNSNAHDHFPLPVLLMGGGRGRVKGNQHLKYPDRTALANLLATVLDRADVHVDHVGDSARTLSEV